MVETTNTGSPIVSVRDITVQFPGVLALDKVSMDLHAGEVRALMGRNGAGKSTLVKVLSGVYRQASGEVHANGEPVDLKTPDDAMKHGIITVHQELTIVPGLSVAENILLGQWQTKGLGRIDRKSMAERAKSALALLGEDLDINAAAGSLSIAHQQLVEIARALTHEPRVLILDEPTSSLPAGEVERLLTLVRKLAAAGMAVIYVSHRMDEIARVADSVTVVRDGRIVGELPIADAPVAKVAELMVGPDTELSRDTSIIPPVERDQVALRVIDITDEKILKNVNFEVYAGETVGIAGLLGAGRTELLRAIAGLEPRAGGQVEVFGKSLRPNDPRRMIAEGVTLVPEDRKKEGLVLGLSVGENLWMSSHDQVSSGGVLSKARANKMAGQSKSDLDIKVTTFDVLAETLSGGNQQKVVVGRCLNAGARVLLLDEPTRGVDVHAKQQMYELIRKLSSQGHAVVVVSSEYEELLLVCHRILFLVDGRLTDEVDPKTINMSELLARVMRTEAA